MSMIVKLLPRREDPVTAELRAARAELSHHRLLLVAHCQLIERLRVALPDIRYAMQDDLTAILAGHCPLDGKTHLPIRAELDDEAIDMVEERERLIGEIGMLIRLTDNPLPPMERRFNARAVVACALLAWAALVGLGYLGAAICDHLACY